MKQYIETNFNNYTLRGYHHKCDTSTCVIFLHGFTGHKTESHYMFARLSNALEKQNIASIRFDFLGSGESDGEFFEMTWDKLVKQVQHIIDFAAPLYDDLHLFGFSMGGALAMHTTDKRINSIVGLAPALNMGSLQERLEQNATKTPNNHYDVSSLEVSTQFTTSFKDANLKEVPIHDKPLCVIQGTNDQAVPKDTPSYILKTNPDVALHYIEGADHVFSSHVFYSTIEKRTIEWIKQRKA